MLCDPLVMSDDLNVTVGKWLDEAGLGLELRTARAVAQAGLQVLEGYTFTDPTQGTDREGDVLGYKVLDAAREAPYSFAVAIECKDTDAVWIGVRQATGGMPNPNKSTSWYAAEQSDIAERAVARGIEDGLLSGSDLRLSCSRVVVGPPNQQRKNAAYDAVRQVLSAASAVRGSGMPEETDRQGNLQQSPGVSLAVIVTTARLFRAALGDDNQLHHEQVSRLDVFGEINGERRPVIIINEGELEPLLGKVAAL